MSVPSTCCSDATAGQHHRAGTPPVRRRVGEDAGPRRAARPRRRRWSRRPAPATRRPPSGVRRPSPSYDGPGRPRRSTPRRSTRCSSPSRSGRSVPGSACRCRPGAVGGQRGGGRDPRVHDHQPTGAAGGREVLHERRHRVGHVAAHQQHRVRPVDVLDREGQAPVDAERSVAGRGGRGHAEPAVVVDVPGPEHHPGELAELVGLLVGQPATAEDADGVPSVLGPGSGAAAPRRTRAPRPRWPVPAPVGVADQRRGQPVRGGQHLGRGPALLAQPAPVGREVARLRPPPTPADAHAESVIAHCSAQYGQWVRPSRGVVVTSSDTDLGHLGAGRR